ncbi:hypothetical protein GCM10023081_36370 [Arthrobacter ginkgonis]|uniref:Uncharacterized protein n=1 Tax=Arthrobacter ginkgonis TaxID=1630594 RepID=A0ABP7CYN3_9MICC
MPTNGSAPAAASRLVRSTQCGPEETVKGRIPLTVTASISAEGGVLAPDSQRQHQPVHQHPPLGQVRRGARAVSALRAVLSAILTKPCTTPARATKAGPASCGAR